MKNRPSLFAVLLAGAFAGSLVGKLLADAGVHLSLVESDEEAIDMALLGKRPGPESQNLFSSVTATVSNMPYNVFVRNRNLWIGPDVDLTAIGAYNNRSDGYGTKFEITAISPMHCIGSAHVTPQKGQLVNFVGSDNRTYTRSVVATANPADDIEISMLDSPLPPSVTPMHVLPPDWKSYLKPGTQLDLPVIFVNQANRLYVAEAAGIQAGTNPQVIYRPPSTAIRAAFNAQVISGDSSFPQMVLVNGTPAILSLWHYGGYGAGPLVPAYYDQINLAMKQLSRKAGMPLTYQLRAADMTGISKQ